MYGASARFALPVRDIRAYTGAGWLVALCGDVMTMPGLGEKPAAVNVDIDENGRTIGLFWPRPVKWCPTLSASSSLDGYAIFAMAVTSSNADRPVRRGDRSVAVTARSA